MIGFHEDEVHPSWLPTLLPLREQIDSILLGIEKEPLAPSRENVFRAFLTPKKDVKVVIVGQDPYPGIGVADGLAFSQRDGVTHKVPASLRNIFLEYSADLGLPIPITTDLSPWARQGVLLLNRTLTNREEATNAHVKLGWQEITDVVAQSLSQQRLVAILWGRYAQELRDYFPNRIESVHPSPLSARRGFFGSKPFSQANTMLIEQGLKPIDWTL